MKLFNSNRELQPILTKASIAVLLAVAIGAYIAFIWKGIARENTEEATEVTFDVAANPYPVAHPIRPNLQDPSMSAEEREFLIREWPHLIATCPGLTEYSQDLMHVRTVTFGPIAKGDRGWIAVSIKVSNAPERIPKEYRAAGNTCDFKIDDEGSFVAISKRSCANVCLSADIGDLYGRDLKLPMKKN